MNWRDLTDTIRFFFKSRSEAAKLLREAMTQVQQAEDLRQQVRTLQEDLRGYEALKLKVKDLQSRLAYQVDLKVQREHEARHLAKEIKSLRAKNRGRK